MRPRGPAAAGKPAREYFRKERRIAIEQIHRGSLAGTARIGRAKVGPRPGHELINSPRPLCPQKRKSEVRLGTIGAIVSGTRWVAMA
jgi:hypothetical protein